MMLSFRLNRAAVVLLYYVANYLVSGFVFFTCLQINTWAKDLKTSHKMEMHLTSRLEIAGYINGIAWSNDATKLAVLSDFGITVNVFDTTNWKLLKRFRRFSNGYSGSSITFLEDGTLLLSAPTGYSPDPLKSFDRLSFEQIDPLSGVRLQYIWNRFEDGIRSRSMHTFAVSASGKEVAGFPISHPALISIFSTKGWSLKKNISVTPTAGYKNSAGAVSFSPSSPYLAIGTNNGLVEIENLLTDTLQTTVDLFPGTYIVDALGYNARGDLLAAGAYQIYGPRNGANALSIISTNKFEAMKLPTGFYISRVWDLSWRRDGLLAVG